MLYGRNSDSGNFAMPARFDGSAAFAPRLDARTAFGVLAEARVRKSAAEVELMRYVNWVSSMAHVEVMRATKPGLMEYQVREVVVVRFFVFVLVSKRASSRSNSMTLARKNQVHDGTIPPCRPSRRSSAPPFGLVRFARPAAAAVHV